MKPYTYFYIKPSCKPPFKKTIRCTFGQYMHTTEPTGTFGFRYAVFLTRTTEVLIPLHDLTPETKARIKKD